MTYYTAAFNGEIIPPEDQRTQYSMDFEDREHDNPLPRDGLPRITSEGLAILLEGLHGDFHRWKWSIGNHPLELPAGTVRNVQIRAMKDEPHFLADTWTGLKWPKTKHNYRAMPTFFFDEVDTMSVYNEPHGYIMLCQSSDHWAGAPIFIDDIELWEDGPADDEEELVDCCTPAPEPAKALTFATLDAWMGAGQ